MVAVLQVTPAERASLAFTLARFVPVWARGTAEQQDVASQLGYVLRELDQVPPGPGEIELMTQDLYELGLHIQAAAADLEEYWLDLVHRANGGEPVETPEPEVVAAAARYFPTLAADPRSWDFRAVQPAFIDLGFKLDTLVTAEAPRVRGLYNKEWSTLALRLKLRKEENAAKRTAKMLVGASVRALPAPSAVAEHEEDTPRSCPVGTAQGVIGGTVSRGTPVSRATWPPQYLWGVDTSTGVNVDDLEPGRAKKADVGGEALMLAEVDGKVCAATRICPHRQWDLSSSPVVGGTITCNLHGARYDVCSGEVLRQPFDPSFNKEHALMGGLMAALDPKHDAGPLQTYPTYVTEDGEIRIHI